MFSAGLEEVEDMDIAAVKSVTSATVSDYTKDPPWAAEDQNKLRMLMDQGFSAAEMARKLGTTISAVSQKMAALSTSTRDTTATGSSGVPETAKPTTGANLDIKI
jgi:hypothetical protein